MFEGRNWIQDLEWQVCRPTGRDYIIVCSCFPENHYNLILRTRITSAELANSVPDAVWNTCISMQKAMIKALEAHRGD